MKSEFSTVRKLPVPELWDVSEPRSANRIRPFGCGDLQHLVDYGPPLEWVRKTGTRAFGKKSGGQLAVPRKPFVMDRYRDNETAASIRAVRIFCFTPKGIIGK